MLRILHISDCHAQSETTLRLNRLAYEQSDCDVVVHTGDCLSATTKILPEKWDKWPQKYKFAVPGNHYDHSNSYSRLRTWTYQTPWAQPVQDILFVGCGLGSWERVGDSLRNLLYHRSGYKALVLAGHEPPENGELMRLLGEWLKTGQLLLLHGHDHLCGFESHNSEVSNGNRVYRSRVCSSDPRGFGYRITWSDGTFSCIGVQGSRY